MSQRPNLSELNQYHLGIWYSAYRFIISSCLLIIFLFTYNQLNNQYQYPKLYLYVLTIYVIVNSLQFFALNKIKTAIPKQMILIFFADVTALSLLTLALDGPNLHLSLLFVITIFAASILLDARKALVITLIAVISVIYQLFLGSILDFASLRNIGNSALLAFLFFVVYGCGQIAVRRFQILENLNFSQSIELHQLQNINRYILEQIETGYLVLDENCHVVLSNPAACHLLGIPAAYSADKYPLYMTQPDLFELLKFEDLKDGEKFQFESQQSLYHIHVHVKKLIVPHQLLTLLVLQDAQKLNQQVQQLKLAALGQLSASIAHEIRNPLAAIAQANELNQDSDTEQKLLLNQMIAKQITRIDKIIKDTLDLAKNKKTQASKIHLPTFIDDLMHHDLQDVQSSIKLSMLSKHPIHFDESQLRQVLVNLIRNALRHNAQQAEYIELKLHETRSHLLIDVIDFGSGIAEQDLAQLFQPFFSTEINGTGLGLYLSHSICEANQAKLVYVEQKQQGACFRIECPLMD